jgi:hypothetical protein
MQVSTPTDTIVDAIGTPTFQANDFVIVQMLGALNVRSVSEGTLGAERGSGASDGNATRVNVFAATFESGKPFQGPVTVLLKEFVPCSRAVGLNELRLLSLLEVRPSGRSHSSF